jgi:hypothetical protein
MNEYVAFLLQELSVVEARSEESRRNLYERVRNELVGKLEQSEVRKTTVEVAGERRALERAIGLVEDDLQKARLIPADICPGESIDNDAASFQVDHVLGMVRDISAECLPTVEASRSLSARRRRRGFAGLIRTMWK